ncbi:MAG: motility protein A [Nitrospinae bacterium]|nr:motility protein A [Nitrospinota bacterium]
MDIATVIGTVLAFGLIIGAIMTKGSIFIFVDPASALIVAGGTLGAALISYPLADVINTIGVVKNTVFAKVHDEGERIAKIIEYAGMVRKDGILGLESHLDSMGDDFMQKGFRFAVDGIDPQAIEDVLTTEIDYVKERHDDGANIMGTLAALSPAFGMIGTLIGLVLMLQNMEDPNAIGPSMAVALITTFYGAIMANAIFTPLSVKLKKRSKEEVLIMELTKAGILAVIAGENPRIIEQKLNVFVPPGKRVSQFD